MENVNQNLTVLDSGGSGKVLVFLHGFMESKELWQDFVPSLQSQYRVILLDLPGHGANTAAREDYSIESAANYVRETLQALQVNKFLLIGHSMGGYISMAFAEKYPELLTGVVLFHSSALPDTDEKKENRNKTIQFIQKHGVNKFMDTFVVPLFYEGNQHKQAAAIAFLTETGKKVAPTAVIGAVTAMRDRPDRTEVLRQADFPFLFISGKQDQAVTLAQTLQQCHLPKIAYTLFLDQTGHVGMFERPVETLAAVRNFAKIV